jgi:hypothetical protein
MPDRRPGRVAIMIGRRALGKLRARRRAHNVMGAGVATSPHFPGVDRHAREGMGFFPGRIGSRLRSCDPNRFLLGFPTEALLPRRVPFRVSDEISLSRQIPFRDSLCPKVPVSPDGPEIGIGIGFRLCLTLLPRSPCHSLPRLSSLRMSAVSAVAVARSILPFPVGRFRLQDEAVTAARVGQTESACG